MRPLIRLRPGSPPDLARYIIPLIVVLSAPPVSLTAGQREGGTAGAGTEAGLPPSLRLSVPPSSSHAIVVGRAVEGDGARVETLLDAERQAASDPRDNVIRFDPVAFGTGAVTIRLAEPIVAVDPGAPGGGGRDRIDGSALEGGLTLDTTACADAGIVVGGEAGLVLQNLTIRGGQQRSILVKDTGRIELQNVTVTRAGGPGVVLFGGARAELRECKLVGNRTHGLELHGEARAALDNVELSRNGQSGLAAFDQSAVEATNCTLDANSDWNAVLTGASRAKLARCTLSKGRFANADVSGTVRLELVDCTLERGERFGIFATGGASLVLTRTRLSEHRGRGIELQDRAAANLTGSRLADNQDYGLILFGDATLRGLATSFAGNGAHGVSFRDRTAGELTHCTFTGNRYSGVGCLDAGDGGAVKVTRCLFRDNGMRPIYRGPLHIDPIVPTPIRIRGDGVEVMTEPGAEIELYVDRAGEAGRYLRTVRADASGRFDVSCNDVPAGWVMTAAATVRGVTSEFNVIAGTTPGPVLRALVGRCGPLSDEAGDPGAPGDTLLRRWRPGTHLVFHIDQTPSSAVVRYARFLVDRVGEWTGGSLSAEVAVGEMGRLAPGTIVIPVRYLEPGDPQLLGRGGVTFMKWDEQGHFMLPMEIVLARGAEPRETCPRVLAHEIGHALGLCHVRVGLLSRMQGSVPSSDAFVNDFSPMMTYYDVLALQILHDRRLGPGATLDTVVEHGLIPPGGARLAAGNAIPDVSPTFSPTPNLLDTSDSTRRRDAE